MDVPASDPGPAARPRTARLVLVVVGIVVILSVVFGITVMRRKSQFEQYRAATLERGPLPWSEQPHSIEQCVAYTVDWAMECPGVASWCSSEAPRLTGDCLASQDRQAACEALGDEVASTHFGYDDCERRRESVKGRYTKRNHKKFCAASYRAVAEFCRQTLGTSPDSRAPTAQ